MKKLIYTILAAAATLFAVSCARETEKEGFDNGTTVEAQFNLGFAGTLTKAFSDGLSATQLVVGVYDRQLGYLESISISPDNSDYKYAFASLQTTYTARLVKGHGYDIVFLAVAPDNGIYSIDLEKGTFTVNPNGPSNEELRDAFYAVYSIDRVAAAIDQTITLTRPFAQINVISEKQDFEAAVAAKVEFGKSALKINAPTVMNLVDGSVGEPADYFLTPAVMPVEGAARGAHPNFEPYFSKGDYWLMTDYILVDPNGGDADVNFTLYAKDTDDELFSYSIPNVALKQNYRTNIYGSVLTTDSHFTVVIEPEYFGEMETPVEGVVPEIKMYDTTLPADGGIVRVNVGDKVIFTAYHPIQTVQPEYFSSVEEVGTINTAGLFTALADGKTIVTIYFPAVWNGEPTDDPGVVPGGDTPGGDTPGGDTPGGDTPGGDTPGGDTPGGDTPGTTNGEGTLSSPYNVQGAYDAAAALAADAVSEKDVYITGKISSIKYSFSADYGTATFNISADGTTSGTQFTCYSVYYLGNRAWAEGDTQIAVGNSVTICGKITNYKGDTPETASKKAYIYSLNGNTAPAGLPAVKADAATVNYSARVIQYTVIVGEGGDEPTGDKGTKGNPYTVSEALTVINGLEDGAKTEEEVYVKGVITEVKNVDTGQYGNAEYSIGDSADDTNTLLVYRGYYLDGEKFTAEDQIKKGDQVVVCGKLQKYVKDNVTTPEIANGSKIVSINGEGGDTPDNPDTPVVAGTDVLDRAFTGVEGSNYADWSGKKGSGSSAVYAGNTAGGNDAIQMRSNNNNSGIVSTTSGGKLAKVEVVWNTNTADERKLDIYGSNTAYTSPADLYDEAKRGTKIGTIAKGETSLAVSDSYTYVGIRSASGALYLDKVSISWGEGGGTTPVDPVDPVDPPSGDVKTVTVAQFNAASEDVNQKYQLTGTITNLTNTTYGNFTLKDNTGEVLVYGLTATEQEWDKVNKKITNDKSFASLNLKAGDTVTLIGYRIDYNNAPEVAGAYYVSSVPGTDPGTDPGTTDPDPVDGTAVTMTEAQLAAAAAGGATVNMDSVISFTNSSDYGSNTPAQLRIYKGKTLTISAKSGYSIKQIVFTCTANGAAQYGPGSWGAGAPTGYTFDADGPTGTWTGSSSSVEFTATDNQVRIKELKVIYKAN